MIKRNASVWLGLTAVILSAAAMIVWVPADSTSPPLAEMRGRTVIGDAMAPMIALALCFVGGIVTILETRKHDVAPHMTRQNLLFLLMTLTLLGVSLALMRWGGPSSVAISNAISGNELLYRNLRDTAPWKYIGFLLGGTLMIAGPIALVEGRLSMKSVVVGLGAAALMVLAYDIPFDDLLLPPNGDL